MKSSASVELKSDTKLADLVKSLEQSAIDKDKAAPIKADEIKKALFNYISIVTVEGVAEDKVTEDQRFGVFLKDVLKKGYNHIGINAGKLEFSNVQNNRVEATPPLTSNPLGTKQLGREDVAYAHENLRLQAELREKDNPTPQPGQERPTRFDATATEVARRLNNRKEAKDVTKDDLKSVDTRYLSAMEAVLSYNNGPAVDVPLPFNEANMPCKFSLDGGAYVLSWNGGKGYHRYTPRGTGKDALENAKMHLTEWFNKGTLGQEIQRENIKNKSFFEYWGQKVDAGPENAGGGAQRYEFSWDVGVLGGDPDVTVKALPHGELEVKVEQGKIGLNGEKEYVFRAGGFQDMMRTIKRLQRWAESSDENRAKNKEVEQNSRGFETLRSGKSAIEALNAQSLAAGAGRILKIQSRRNMEKGGVDTSRDLGSGYVVDFDWMQKLEPAQRLQIKNIRERSYEFTLIPSNERLGDTGREVSVQEALEQALKLVAEQRKFMVEAGQEKEPEKAFQGLLEQVNKSTDAVITGPFAVIEGVTVKTSTRESIYYLALPGMPGRQFNFGTKQKPNMAEFQKAVVEGYMLSNPNGRLSALKIPGETTERPTFPDQRITGVKNVMEQTGWDKNDARFNALLQYLHYRVLAFTPGLESTISEPPEYSDDKPSPVRVFYEDCAWRILANLAGIPKGEVDEGVKKSVKSQLKLDNVLGKISPCKFIEADAVVKLPQTNAMIMSFLDTLDDLSSEFDQKEFVVLKQSYSDQIKDLYISTRTQNPQKDGQKDVDYDAALRGLMSGRVKRPDIFIKEYKAKLSSTSTEVPSQVVVPEKPKTSISATWGDKPRETALVDKLVVDTVNDALNGVRDSDGIRAYLTGRLAGETFNGSDDNAKKEQCSEKVWNILGELTGVSLSLGQTWEDYQKTIRTALSAPKTKDNARGKIDQDAVKEFNADESKKLATLPTVKSLVAAYLSEVRMTEVKNRYFNPDPELKFDGAKKSYVDAVKTELTKALQDARKQTETTQKYDERIRKLLEQKLKSPAEFFAEFSGNEAKKKAYKDYQEKTAAQATFEARRKNPNGGMLFADFEKSRMLGLAADALTAIRAAQGVKTDTMRLASVPGNTPAAMDKISFNHSVGTPGNEKPVTLNFYQTSEGIQVSVNRGWNNVELRAGSARPISGSRNYVGVLLERAASDSAYLQNPPPAPDQTTAESVSAATADSPKVRAAIAARQAAAAEASAAARPVSAPAQTIATGSSAKK